MNTIEDRMIITPYENKMKRLVADVDETSKNLGIEASIADQYATLIFEMPTYQGIESFLGDIPVELRSTASFWRDSAKPALMKSVNRLSAFCSSFTSYFPELLEALSQGATDLDAEKDNLLTYLHEISPKAAQTSTALQETLQVSKEFLTKTEGNEEKLQAIVPIIEDKFTDQKKQIKANQDALKEIDGQISALTKKRITTVAGMAVSGAGSLVGGATLGVSALALKLETAGIITEKTPIFAGRFASTLAKKVLVGTSVVFVAVNVIGLIAMTASWSKSEKELEALRKKQAQLSQEGVTLNADAAVLNNMTMNYAALLKQAVKVPTAFKLFNEKWLNIELEIEKIIEKLKDLSSTVQKDIGNTMIDLKALNDEFLLLRSELIQYELNFVLPVAFESPSLQVSTQFMSAPAKLYIPNALYASYTRH